MALTKETTVDQITVLDNGVILYREATCIFDDGVEVSKKYHRTSLTPGQDISNQPDKVKDIANVAWTSEVLAAYEAFKQEQAKRLL